MSRADLRTLIDELHRRGLHERADAVQDIGRAVDALERPPGIVGRVTARARREAARQWRLALDEWGESREALRLLRERVGGRELRPEEADALRRQAFDFLRSVPAGVLTAASALVPVPGFMLVTPWMLSRLGLLPSRWREEALLARLQEEARALHEQGEDAGAQQLESLAAEVADRRELRDELSRRAAVHTYWDLDGDGEISAEEQAAYDDEVARLVGAVPEVGPERRWFLMLGEDVIGPVRFGETLGAEPDLPLLLCLDGDTGWVRLADVRTRGGFTSHPDPAD